MTATVLALAPLPSRARRLPVATLAPAERVDPVELVASGRAMVLLEAFDAAALVLHASPSHHAHHGPAVYLRILDTLSRGSRGGTQGTTSVYVPLTALPVLPFAPEHGRATLLAVFLALASPPGETFLGWARDARADSDSREAYRIWQARSTLRARLTMFLGLARYSSLQALRLGPLDPLETP